MPFPFSLLLICCNFPYSLSLSLLSHSPQKVCVCVFTLWARSCLSFGWGGKYSSRGVFWVANDIAVFGNSMAYWTQGVTVRIYSSVWKRTIKAQKWLMETTKKEKKFYVFNLLFWNFCLVGKAPKNISLLTFTLIDKY